MGKKLNKSALRSGLLGLVKGDIGNGLIAVSEEPNVRISWKPRGCSAIFCVVDAHLRSWHNGRLNRNNPHEPHRVPN